MVYRLVYLVRYTGDETENENMAYSDYTRKQALSAVQERIKAGRGVRHSLHAVSEKLGISYPTIRRWHYEIKDRPVTNPAMAEIGACWNLQEAMKGRRGALDRVCRVYMKLTGHQDDLETVEEHYRLDILYRMSEMANNIRARHIEMGNQYRAVASVAREYDFPARTLTKWYRMVRKEAKMEQTRKIVIKNFPKDLDEKAKAYARENHLTFKALVIKSLQLYMEQNK
jgi:hypothetical protein